MSKDTQLQKLGRLTIGEFFARFPDEDACLNHIMEVRYGLRHVCAACGVEGTFHKLANRRAFSCAHCGHHVYPTAGTIFQDTRTPLQVWFYAIYLFVTTRHGVSGKELQRALGVTYKTAWRMGQQIRTLMAKADGFEMMKGHVEIDEAYIGGRRAGGGPGAGHNKTIVLGIVERGGRTVAQTVPNLRKETIRPFVYKNIERGSLVSTDEANLYKLLKRKGYEHKSVNHSKYEWRKYNYRHEEWHHTNSVESFWKLFKNSIRSTHIHVSPKYMDRYLREFTFRSNHRQMTNAMFDLLISAV
ncbi:MAG TPA: IS1595 family transposase [Xanthobacteraceae bacterium]|nr:IS1595 family transposase [Xanthobacteraceae bacterium]